MTSNGTGDGWDLIVSPWHLDEHIPAWAVPAGATALVGPSLPAASQLQRMNLLHQSAAAAVARVRAARPLLLACDCPAAIGAVAELQQRYDDMAVVWLDGHGDFNTPATTISGYLGGMPLAMLTGRAPELISEALGLRPVADDHAVLVDARDLDPAERDALGASQVRRVPADPAAIRSALGPLGRTPVYLHIDVDVIDSSRLPGLRYPASPGPDLARIADCVADVITTAEVVGACIASTSTTRPRTRPSPGSAQHSAPSSRGKDYRLMSVFSDQELAYLAGRRLGRLATIGPDGLPHVVPLGWSYNPALDTIDVGGRDMARTRKFRNVQGDGKAALVIDDVLPPWQPRGVMVRGPAEALEQAVGADGQPVGPIIRIHPAQVISWGLDADADA